MSTSAGGASRGGRGFQIFLVSLVLMMFEVNLVRLFSVLMYYHLAFFVLALSLFGIGIGGLYAHLLRSYFERRNKHLDWMDYLPLLLSIAVVGTLFFLVSFPLGRMDGQLPGMGRMMLTFVLASLPFMIGSMFISNIFANRPQDAGTLYFSDLVGASAGCLAVVPAMQWLGGLNTPLLVAILAVIPVVAGAGKGFNARKTAAWAVGGFVVVVALVSMKFGLLSLPGPLPGEVLFSKWNFYSHISVQENPGWRGWWLSPNYDGPINPHLQLFQDRRAPAFIEKFDGDFEKVKYLRHDITALPYYITDPVKVLIIGAGGGRDILTAKLFGVPDVTGVELNPITAGLMRNEFRDYSGNVYGMEGVRIAVDNGRTFVQRDDQKYDLIYTSLADTQSANNQGAYVLSENHLYTIQAFESYWDRLVDDGVCSVITAAGWGEHMTRTVNTVARALERKGVSDPASHIIVIMTPEYPPKTPGMCIAYSKVPVSKERVLRTRKACDALGFSVAWPAQPDRPHEWTERLGQLTNAATEAQAVAKAAPDLSPLDDNRPYLFYSTKPKDFLRLMWEPHTPSMELRAYVRAFYLLMDFFVVVCLCVLLLMFSPLLLFRRHELRQGGRLQLKFLALFFLLGIAYMLVEVSLLQHLFLLLGDPTLTFAVLLCAMLGFTGAGSLISRRFPPERLGRTMAIVALVAVVVQSAALMALPSIVYAAQGAPVGVKLAVVTVLVALLAMPMGMLFPSAIRLIGISGLNMTCWAWGMNGVGSVLGSVGATLISMNFGIRATFLSGIACYVFVVAIASVLKLRQAEAAPADAVQEEGAVAAG